MHTILSAAEFSPLLSRMRWIWGSPARSGDGDSDGGGRLACINKGRIGGGLDLTLEGNGPKQACGPTECFLWAGLWATTPRGGKLKLIVHTNKKTRVFSEESTKTLKIWIRIQKNEEITNMRKMMGTWNCGTYTWQHKNLGDLNLNATNEDITNMSRFLCRWCITEGMQTWKASNFFLQLLEVGV